jgi:hypothetical protein
MSSVSKLANSGSGFYVTDPGYENHYYKGTGTVSIKAGICSGKHDGQKYVNHRYGLSRLHLYQYKPEVSFERMQFIERQVLSGLVNLGYRKQYCKKEHFIIPNKKSARIKFVNDVKNLYGRLL